MMKILSTIDFSTILTILTAIISGAILWVRFYLNSRFSKKTDIDKVTVEFNSALVAVRSEAEKKSATTNERIIEVEKSLKDLPSKDDFHDLSLSLETCKGDMRELSAKLEPVGHLAQLLLEKELRESNK